MFYQTPPYSLQSSVPDALKFYLLIKQPYLFNTSTSYRNGTVTCKEGKEGRKESTVKMGKAVTFEMLPFPNLLKASLIPRCGLYIPLAQQLCLECYHETRS